MSTSGFRLPKTAETERIFSKEQINLLFALIENQNSPVIAQKHSVGLTKIHGGGQAFLPLSGGQLAGPLAFEPEAQIIDSDSLDLSKLTGAFAPRIIVNGEGSADDFIDTIIAGDNPQPGEIRIIQGVFGIDITFRDKNGTAVRSDKNFRTADGNEFVLQGNRNVAIIYDSIANEWTFLDTMGFAEGANKTLSNLNSPTAINQDLLFSTTGLDIGDTTNPVDSLFVEQVRLQTGTVTVNVAMITKDVSNNMILNVDTALKFLLQFGGTTKYDFSQTSFTAPNIILSNILTLNDNAGDPLSNGQLARNGNDVKVFTGGAVKNLTSVLVSPLTADLDCDGFDLDDVGSITKTLAGGSIAAESTRFTTVWASNFQRTSDMGLTMSASLLLIAASGSGDTVQLSAETIKLGLNATQELQFIGEALSLVFKDRNGIKAAATSNIAIQVTPDSIDTSDATWVGSLQIPYVEDTDSSPSSTKLNNWFGGNVNAVIAIQYDSSAAVGSRNSLWAKTNLGWNRAVQW